jgi:hypothetical protein
MFVLLPWNRCPNASPLQVLAIFPESVAFIARDPHRTDAQMTIGTPDRPLFHELLGYRNLVLLTGS